MTTTADRRPIDTDRSDAARGVMLSVLMLSTVAVVGLVLLGVLHLLGVL